MNFNDDYKTFNDNLKPGEGTFVHTTVTVRVPVCVATRKDSINSAAELYAEIIEGTWAALDSNYTVEDVKPEDIVINHLELRPVPPIAANPQLASEADTRVYMGLDDGDWTFLPTHIQLQLRLVTWKATN